MIERIVSELGPWAWVVIGFILLAAEIVAPGVFLLWIGLAMIAVGAVAVMLGDFGATFFGWQAQMLAFVALALAFVLIGRRYMRKGAIETDEPSLNRRADQLIGRTAVLAEPIDNGTGRIKLGDTLWRVTGPDLPAGTKVRVVAAHGGELRVDGA